MRTFDPEVLETLLRPIRHPPVRPTREMLRRVMRDYGLSYALVAEMMDIHPKHVGRYLRPDASKYLAPIPMIRWRALLAGIEALHHPGKPVKVD